MIAIIDYGVGNLFSLESSFAAVGHAVCVTSDVDALRKADKLILPGVGAFGDAADKLFSSGLGGVLLEEAEKGKPVLGICLGMQLLFEKGEEFGVHRGLGLLPGRVRAFEGVLPPGMKIPQIGWNALKIKRRSPILRSVREGDYVYFVHSFFADDCAECVIAETEYGVDVPAVVGRENIYGCQFHPEKSGKVGLGILADFAAL